jgi:hypothetical protein
VEHDRGMLAVDLLTRVGLATLLGVAIGSAYSFDQAGDRLRVAANWFLQPLANRMDRVHTSGRSREAAPADYSCRVMCPRGLGARVKASRRRSGNSVSTTA